MEIETKSHTLDAASKTVWQLDMLDTSTLSLVLAYLPFNCITALIITGKKDLTRKLNRNGAVKVIDFAVTERSRPAIMSAIPMLSPTSSHILNFAIPRDLKTRFQGAHTLHLPRNESVQTIRVEDLPSSLTTFTSEFNELPVLREGCKSFSDHLPHLLHLGLKVGNSRPPIIPNLLSSLPSGLLILSLSTTCKLQEFNGTLPPTLTTFDLKGSHFVSPSKKALSEADLRIKLPSSLTDLRLDPYELKLMSKAAWRWTNLTLLRRFHLSAITYEARILLPDTITHFEMTSNISLQELSHLSMNWPPNISKLLIVCQGEEKDLFSRSHTPALHKQVTSLRLMDRSETTVLLNPDTAKSFFGDINSPLSYYFGENLTSIELPEHIIAETILQTVVIRKKLTKVAFHDVMLSGISIPSDLAVLARIEDLEAPFWHYWVNQQRIPLILTSMRPLKRFFQRKFQDSRDLCYAPKIPETITHLLADDHGVSLRNLPSSIVEATGVHNHASYFPLLPNLTRLSFERCITSHFLSKYMENCPKLTYLRNARIIIPPSFFPENLHLFRSQLALDLSKEGEDDGEGTAALQLSAGAPSTPSTSSTSAAPQSSSTDLEPLSNEINLPQDIIKAYLEIIKPLRPTLENSTFDFSQALDNLDGALPLYEKYFFNGTFKLKEHAIPSGARSVYFGPQEPSLNHDAGFPRLPSSVTHLRFEGVRAIILVYGPQPPSRIVRRGSIPETHFGPTSRFANFDWLPQNLQSVEVSATNWPESTKFTLQYLPNSVTSLVVTNPSIKLDEASIAATPSRMSERSFTNDGHTFTAKVPSPAKDPEPLAESHSNMQNVR